MSFFVNANLRHFWVVAALIFFLVATIILRWVLFLEANKDKKAQKSTRRKRRDGKVDQDCCEEDEEESRNDDKSKDLSSPSSCAAILIRSYGLEEVKVATKNFKMKIGVGATSFVYLADFGDAKFAAVKRVLEERGGSQKIFLHELSVLLRISHPNLVALMGFCMDKGEQLLLLEYIPNRTLFDRMHTKEGKNIGPLTWSNRINIALDIARALHYLHNAADPPVIHRDVKSSNILLIDNDHAKLADFGLCKLGHDNHDYSSATNSTTPTPASIKGSFGYIDISYLTTGLVSQKCDVYSFGVFLLELITGLKSTQGSTTLAEWTEDCRKTEDLVQLMSLVDPKLDIDDVNTQQLRVVMDVANQALLLNSESRPNMVQIVDKLSSCMQQYSEAELPV